MASEDLSVLLIDSWLVEVLTENLPERVRLAAWRTWINPVATHHIAWSITVDAVLTVDYWGDGRPAHCWRPSRSILVFDDRSRSSSWSRAELDKIGAVHAQRFITQVYNHQFPEEVDVEALIHYTTKREMAWRLGKPKNCDVEWRLPLEQHVL